MSGPNSSRNQARRLTPPPEGRELSLAATIMQHENTNINPDMDANTANAVYNAIDHFVMKTP